jgi:hypothetical protein
MIRSKILENSDLFDVFIINIMNYFGNYHREVLGKSP